MAEFGLIEGAVYSRQEDIHPRFGGSHQSGIAPAPKSGVVLIFTGEEGERFGYRDEWIEPKREVYRYTGHGQRGDMRFVSGNRAVRDHVENGRALLLFKKHSRAGGLYTFEGEMQCADTIELVGTDVDGKHRKIIQFLLVRIDAADLPPAGSTPKEKKIKSSLKELRGRAYAAVKPKQGAVEKVRRNLYERSEAVADYVLARADGICECCNHAAPFIRTDGTPYLEVHHIERLSDGGLDRSYAHGRHLPNLPSSNSLFSGRARSKQGTSKNSDC